MTRPQLLLSKINSLSLSEEQYIEIYKIIKKDNINIMKNNNGIFINLNKLSDNTLTNLEKLILYISNNELSRNN